MRFRLSCSAYLAALAVAGQAAALPPRLAAVPLSQILQDLEQQGDVAYFKEIKWDEISHWKIEYQDKNGRTVALQIDPVSRETKRIP
jgi:hypothetical protein